jgi:hypothetical protein
MRPCVLAAIPIPNDLKAPQLLELAQTVIHGLVDTGIKVISYSCDGTETERAVQRGLREQASTKCLINVESPRPLALNPINFEIPIYKGIPLALIQDAKHGSKTGRNNVASGASLLPLGNFIANFQQVQDLAADEDSPLYIRDVEKLDRQDDNAAARFFSAATLQHLVQKETQDLGLVVYLFVFGELTDAYQNRFIPHSERIRMVLRTRYFVDMWQTYVNMVEGYRNRRYFLSREFVDIISYLVNGLISLIVIHRDHLNQAFPLLPWLHSTEACEHIFGMARQLVKDFTAMDFYHMLPKLEVKVREAALNGSRQDSEMKACASGYNHTYLDSHDIDLLSLAIFPSDAQIEALAQEAAEEAESLISILGILPQSLYHPYHDNPLPPISTWYRDEPETVTVMESGDNDDEAECGMRAVTRLIRQFEEPPFFSSLTDSDQGQLDNLTNAAIAVAVEDHIKMYDIRLV